jgi:hypothetical protein
MIGFIGTSLWLQSITTVHTLNSFLTTSVCLVTLRLQSPQILSLSLSLSLMLRTTVSRPVCLGIKHPSGAYDQIFMTVGQLRVCWCEALSLARGRVCRLQLLLVLASAVILGSEPLGTRHRILLSQIWDIPFRRLLRLAGSRWRYSTPPPQFHYCSLLMRCAGYAWNTAVTTPAVQQRTSILVGSITLGNVFS